MYMSMDSGDGMGTTPERLCQSVLGTLFVNMGSGASWLGEAFGVGIVQQSSEAASVTQVPGASSSVAANEISSAKTIQLPSTHSLIYVVFPKNIRFG